MRILGYINHAATNSSSEHCHVPGDRTWSTVPHLDIPKKAATQGAKNANDYHAQLHFILRESGFLSLQQKGFRWNLHYKGSVFPVVFRTYVPFIIGDTEGHDMLCGHYKCRTGNVAQLCRSCMCPTKLSGWSKAKFEHRLVSKVNRLITNQNLKGLQEISQHYLLNGFDGIRFGNPKRGIFGAVPGEILHLVLLGWFKYTIASFFTQAGQGTMETKQFDSLVVCISSLLSRHSDQ
jgi:hypothetical protein